MCTAEVLLHVPLCAFLSIKGAPSGQEFVLQQGYVLLGLCPDTLISSTTAPGMIIMPVAVADVVQVCTPGLELLVFGQHGPAALLCRTPLLKTRTTR